MKLNRSDKEVIYQLANDIYDAAGNPTMVQSLAQVLITEVSNAETIY